MRFEVVTMTPELASKMLEKNDGNRKLRMHRANFLAKAIETGHWMLTHQAIAVTKRGRLLDGQHRLRAVELAGKPVKMVVAYDVPEETFAVLDAGLPRAMNERLRSDRNHTAICRTLFRLMIRNAVPHEYEIETLLEILDSALRAYDEVRKPGTKVSKLKKAGYSSAIVLRLAEFKLAGDNDGVLRVQWILERLHRADLVGAPPIIHSFYRQALEGVSNLDLGVAPLTDQFCRAWRAFDPASEGVTRLQITDHSTELREAREVFARVSQGVFAS